MWTMLSLTFVPLSEVFLLIFSFFKVVEIIGEEGEEESLIGDCERNEGEGIGY